MPRKPERYNEIKYLFWVTAFVNPEEFLKRTIAKMWSGMTGWAYPLASIESGQAWRLEDRRLFVAIPARHTEAVSFRPHAPVLVRAVR
jgi:hypothetical protein